MDRRSIALGLALTALISGSAYASGGPKGPTQQFLAPESAPAINTLKDATVVKERHTKGFPDKGPKLQKNGSAGIMSCEQDIPFSGYLNCYSHWTGSSAYVNWEGKLKGTVRVDNTMYSTSTTLKYIQSTSGTHKFSVTGTVSATVKGEVQTPIVNFASAEVSGTVTVSGSGEWNWTTSETIEDTMTVPAFKVGYIYAYNASVPTSGMAYYDLYNPYTLDYHGQQGTSTGGYAPAAGAYNYRHVEAAS